MKKYVSGFLALSILFGATRLQAATITPNILTDPAIGDDDTNCSLRYAVEAINDGNTNDVPGCATVTVGTFNGTDDTIVLGPEEYDLTLDSTPSPGEDSNVNGDLDVNPNNIIITGAGSDQTTIDASGILPNRDRVIHLFDIEEASITGVTITGGDVSEISQGGGGILAEFLNLNLQDVFLIGNFADEGGGISYDGSSDQALIIDNSTMDGNVVENGGGGLLISCCGAPTVAISNSTISRNRAVGGDPGSEFGTGGGISDVSQFLFLTNSTISNNTAGLVGGGIFSSGGLKGAYNVTIAFNQVLNPQGRGGGMTNEECCGQDERFTAEIFNTIVAQNTASQGSDCTGTFLSGGNNLIGQIEPNDNCTNFTNNVMGDQVGTSGMPINPQLGGLAFNGGSTRGETHALAITSPAIDRGNPTACQALDTADFIANDPVNLTFVDLTTDQRLLTRPVAVLDPNTPICDIGAYEFQVIPTPSPTPSPTPTPPPTPIPTPPVSGLQLEGSGFHCALTRQDTGPIHGVSSMALFAILMTLTYWRVRRHAQ